MRKIIILAAGLLTLAATSAKAQEFPSGRITVIVPFAPGGGPDVIARLVNTRLSENIRQPIIVENRAGASGMIGADYVKKAPPSGYTLLHASAIFSLAPSLYPGAANNYDPMKDFQPVTQLVNSWALLLVQSQSPVRSVAELVAFIRQKPKGASFGSSGSGTGNHLLAEMFRLSTGLPMLHIPYKGSGLALQDLMGGNFDFMFDPMSSSLNLVKSGKLRALGVVTRTRLPVIPEVPTMAESGHPSVELDQWNGIIAPRGTPRDVVNKLNAEYVKAVRNPDVTRRIEELGVVVRTSTPEEFAQQVEREMVKLGKLVKEANIKAE